MSNKKPTIGSTLSIHQNERAKLRVFANPLKHSFKAVKVLKNQMYKITVPRNQVWIDLFIPCGPEGFSNPIINDEDLKIPTAKCFSLCCSVGDIKDTFKFVGRESVVKISHDGDLIFWPNDHPKFYRNNFGSLKISITRIS